MSLFQENNQENTLYKVPRSVIQTFQEIYEEHENGAFKEIRMSISRSGTKSWEGKTNKDGRIYKNYITEDFLKDNFQKYYKPFYKAVMTEGGRVA